MGGRLFGTDGVRGLANADLTPMLAMRLATAAARVLTQGPGAAVSRAVTVGASVSGRTGRVAGVRVEEDLQEPPQRRRPLAVVGRDPRASGEMLEAAVAAGLASAGVDVVLLGVLPTPAVAFLTGDMRADLGIVISASHNAMPDNGIKIFAAGGVKLEDAVEDAIEARLDDPGELPTGEGVGRVTRAVDADRRYLDHLLVATPNPLTGLKVVVDCAHGASYILAPEVYRRAGAEVVVIGGNPDGLNINAGVGSTYLTGLRQKVIDEGADLGIAHDGDADRCLAVDAKGRTVDGDTILALLAISLRRRGKLAHDTVVATVMANIGFHQAMAKEGIAVRTTGVGDRYVLEEMRAGGFTAGGEQSGHLILSDHATTGDGLLSALHLMAAVAESGRTLADLATVVTKFPQVLINVRVADKTTVAADPGVVTAVRAAEAELGDSGRVLLRPSGTEPVVRVMVEATTDEQAQRVAEQLAAVMRDIRSGASTPA